MLVEKWVMVWEAWVQFPPDSEVSALSPSADWLWYPNFPLVPVAQSYGSQSMKLTNIFKLPYKLLGPGAWACGHLLFCVSTIIRTQKAYIYIANIYSATDLNLPLVFCFVRNYLFKDKFYVEI